MTERRQVSQRGQRVVYPVSFCRRSYQAMKTLQEHIETTTGIQYSLSVITRALGLMAVHTVDTHPSGHFAQLCRECASKGRRKRGSSR